MDDLHEAVFKWPSAGPSDVVITGSFNGWTHDERLTKTSTGFECKVKMPWETKVTYKFIVDGKWITSEAPTELDHDGNLNNVYTSPPRPTQNGSSIVDLAQRIEAAIVAPMVQKDGQPPAQAVEDDLSKSMTDGTNNKDPETLSFTGKQLKATPRPISSSNILSNLASTIVAREGASSPMAYVTTGLGVAIQSVVGIDPINVDKIPLPTPITEATELPEPLSAPEVEPSIPVPDPAEVAPTLSPFTAVPGDDAVPAVSEETHTGAPAAEPRSSTEEPPLAGPAVPDKSIPKPSTPPLLSLPQPDANGSVASNALASLAPSTPADKHVIQPSNSSGGSPTSSKFTTTTSKRKSRSIFGKIRHIFDHDKDRGGESEKSTDDTSSLLGSLNLTREGKGTLRRKSRLIEH